MATSWAGLEQAYCSESGALFNAHPREQGTFLRYGSGRQTPRADAKGRLSWAKERSALFAALYDSLLFDFLDMDEDDEGARVQFACWLWRTTILIQAGSTDIHSLHEVQQVQLQATFRSRMTTFLQAPRHYGDPLRPKPRIRKALAALHGRSFDASVIENFSITQKTAPSWVIPSPYQDAQQLLHLSSLEHPDALCIMLFGVKHPGTQPGIQELALAGCKAWLTRWIELYPGLGKSLQTFFNVLGSQVEALKPVLALLSEREPCKPR